jgi:hypothetical protein
MERIRLGPVFVGAAERRRVHHAHSLERRHRGKPVGKPLDAASRRSARQDGVQHVLVGVQERVAGDVSPPVGELEVDPPLAVVPQRERVVPGRAAKDHQRRADVRRALHGADVEEPPPVRLESVQPRLERQHPVARRLQKIRERARDDDVGVQQNHDVGLVLNRRDCLEQPRRRAARSGHERDAGSQQLALGFREPTVEHVDRVGVPQEP